MTIDTTRLRELLKERETGWPFPSDRALVAQIPALLDELERKDAEVKRHRAFLEALRHELGLILTDDDTDLSGGALRTLLWAEREIRAALNPTPSEVPA